MPSWNEIKENDEYKSLQPADQTRLAEMFFERNIAPEIPPESKEQGLQMFLEKNDLQTTQTPGEGEGDLEPESWVPQFPQKKYPKVERASGLTTRAAITGVTFLPETIANAAIWGVNKLLDDDIPYAGEYTDRLLSGGGLPKPETGAERVFSEAVSGATGTLSTLGIGGLLQTGKTGGKMAKLGQVMLSQKKAQIASGALGGAAAQTTAEAGGGIVPQIGASLLAGQVPFSGGMAKSVAQRALGKGSQEGAQALVESGMESAGAITLAGSKRAKTLQRILETMPSSYFRMKDTARIVPEKAMKQSQKIANKISQPKGTYDVGSMIENSIKGTPNADNIMVGGISDKLLSEKRAMYKNVFKDISDRMPIPETVAKVRKLNLKNEDWEQLTNITGDPTIKQFLGSVERGLEKSGQKVDILGYESATPSMDMDVFDDLRSTVGEWIATSPKGKGKEKFASLYNSLKNDQRDFASMHKVKDKLNKADFFGKEINNYVARLNKLADGMPEDIYNRIAGKNALKKGGTRFIEGFKHLPIPLKNSVRATVIDNMGVSANTGEFVFRNMLHDWKGMDKRVKDVIFQPVRKDYEQLIKISKKFDDLQKTSRGSRMGSLMLGGTGLSSSLIGGLWLGAAGAMGSSWITAKMMTSPKFVKWLAKNSSKKMTQLPNAIRNLVDTVQSSDDQQYKNDITNFIEKIGTSFDPREEEQSNEEATQ